MASRTSRPSPWIKAAVSMGESFFRDRATWDVVISHENSSRMIKADTVDAFADRELGENLKLRLKWIYNLLFLCRATSESGNAQFK